MATVELLEYIGLRACVHCGAGLEGQTVCPKCRLRSPDPLTCPLCAGKIEPGVNVQLTPGRTALRHVMCPPVAPLTPRVPREALEPARKLLLLARDYAHEDNGNVQDALCRAMLAGISQETAAAVGKLYAWATGSAPYADTHLSRRAIVSRLNLAARMAEDTLNHAAPADADKP